MPNTRRRLLLRAFTLLWFCRLALWFFPFRLVARWVARSRVLSASGYEPQQLVRALETGARFVPRATCLVQAFAGARLFAEQGRRAQVVIGARQCAGVLEAHAWLEASGQVVLGNVSDLHSYHPLG